MSTPGEPADAESGSEPDDLPVAGATVGRGATLPPERSGAAGTTDDEDPSDSRIHFRVLAGIGGTGKLGLDLDGQELDFPEQDIDATTVGVNIHFDKLLIPYLGLGVVLGMQFWDTEDGVDRFKPLDVSPALRVRVPIPIEGREWLEVYAVGAAGFTMNFLASAETDSLEEAGLSTSIVGVGYNVLLVGGLQANLHENVGVFAEGGWQLHGMLHPTEAGDASGTLDIMFHQPIVSGGLTAMY